MCTTCAREYFEFGEAEHCDPKLMKLWFVKEWCCVVRILMIVDDFYLELYKKEFHEFKVLDYYEHTHSHRNLGQENRRELYREKAPGGRGKGAGDYQFFVAHWPSTGSLFHVVFELIDVSHAVFFRKRFHLSPYFSFNATDETHRRYLDYQNFTDICARTLRIVRWNFRCAIVYI